MSTLEKWSLHHIKTIIDYLDDDSIRQLTQTAINMSSAEDVAAHFTSFLGETPSVYTFIAEFNSRRFPPSQKASVPSKRAENLVQPGAYRDIPERKADTGKKPVGNTYLTSDMGSKPKATKVKKVDALTEIDAALRELELDVNNDKNKKLLNCDCAARRHGLNPVTPNCLSCGKIICSIESYSRCSYCNAELLSRNAKEEIITELRRERGIESAQAKNQPKKAKAGSNSKVAYAGKVGGNYGSTQTSRMDEEVVREKTQAAESRKNELLAHVKSGYRRTVIDQASDFTAESTDKWLSPAERALALRKAQAAMHADNESGRVISLSLGKGKVSIKNEKKTRRTEDEVDGEIAKEQRRIDEEKAAEAREQDAINKSYTRNKLMGSIGKITFSGSEQKVQQDWWTKGQKGWNRVQDYEDEDDERQEELMLASQAMDGQAGRAEELGTSKRA